MNSIKEKIKSRGYWKVVIRPSSFNQYRISEPGLCKKLIRDNSVRLRGWDYPHYDSEKEPICGLDYVEQFTDWQDHIEAWRFYQSGQFIHYIALWEDWQDEYPFGGYALKIPPLEYLSIFSTVIHLTEIYEFASRLAANGLFDNSCEIQIFLCNTNNRTLKTFDIRRPLFSEFKTMLSEIPRSISLTSSDLMGRSSELALEHVVWLFQRFNWDDVQADSFKEDQRKFLDRSI
mgnify:CR=1 FL=1